VARADAKRILITRSQPGAAVLAAALEAAGWHADVLPLIGTQACAGADVEAVIDSLDGFDVVLFTSVHAVVHFHALLESRARAWPRRACCVAVGTATAAALRERGVAAVAPEDERSEGILDLPIEAFDGGDVLIVGGEGGRRALDAALGERGARVARVAVYRRVGAVAVPPEIDPRRYAAAVVSSVAGGAALAAVGNPGAGVGVRGLRVIVPSERVADAMHAMGFMRVTVSDGAGPAAVVRALASVNEAKDGG